MSTIDDVVTRIGARYRWLVFVAAVAGGYAFATLVQNGHVALGVIVGAGIAGPLVGLRFLTDRTIVDEREEALSRTVAYYTFCVAGCGGTLLLLSGMALDQLGVIVVTDRMVGAGVAITALFVIYLVVDVLVRWSA